MNNAVLTNYHYLLQKSQPWTKASSALTICDLHFNMRGSRRVSECQGLQVLALKQETLYPTAPCQGITIKQVLLRRQDAVRAPVGVWIWTAIPRALGGCWWVAELLKLLDQVTELYSRAAVRSHRVCWEVDHWAGFWLDVRAWQAKRGRVIASVTHWHGLTCRAEPQVVQGAALRAVIN